MTAPTLNATGTRLRPQDLDWNLIRSFIVVVRERSLSKAAQQLGISQPTLSRQIAELEAAFKTQLFERTGRGVQPTDAATALVEPAERMMAGAQSVCSTLADHNAQLTGTVRISVAEVVAAFMLPPLLATFNQLHPGIQIELSVENRISNLLAREADIAIRMGEPGQGAVIAKSMGHWPVGIFAAERYAESIGGVARMDARMDGWAGYRWVGEDRDPVIINRIRNLYPQVTREDFWWRSDNMIVNWMAVQAGVGMGWMLKAIAAQFPSVRLIDVGFPLPSIEVWLICHQGLKSNSRLKLVFDFLAEHLPQAGTLAPT